LGWVLQPDFKHLSNDHMKLKIVFVTLLFCNCAFAFEAPQYDRSTGPTDDTNVIGIWCDEKSKILEIGYFSAYNLPTQQMDLWDTFDLKENKKDSYYVESVHEIVRTCNIDNNQYIVKIRPVPGNWRRIGDVPFYLTKIHLYGKQPLCRVPPDYIFPVSYSM
jgi:hypothetical protein